MNVRRAPCHLQLGLAFRVQEGGGRVVVCRLAKKKLLAHAKGIFP
jgi:hypothetical protein